MQKKRKRKGTHHHDSFLTWGTFAIGNTDICSYSHDPQRIVYFSDTDNLQPNFVTVEKILCNLRTWWHRNEHQMIYRRILYMGWFQFGLKIEAKIKWKIGKNQMNSQWLEYQEHKWTVDIIGSYFYSRQNINISKKLFYTSCL